MESFVTAAPYLSNFFVLIAFCFFIFSVIMKYFFKRRLFPTLTKKASGKIVERMVLYSFVIAIVSIACAFAFKILESYWSNQTASSTTHTKLLPFNTGWIFVGYYDFSGEYYLESQYAQLVYRTDKNSNESTNIPLIGDVWQVKKDRNVVIYNYTQDGLKYQFTNPDDAQFLQGKDAIILEDKDLTGIMVPKDSFIVVRDVGFSPKLPNKKAQAVWIRMAECEPEIDACKAAAELNK